MPAPDAPEDQQAQNNYESPNDRLASRCLRLSQQRLLVVVSEPLRVGAGSKLVDSTSQSVLGLLDLVLNLLSSALEHCSLLESSVSQNLVLRMVFTTSYR
jgi:hypothetical protein